MRRLEEFFSNSELLVKLYAIFMLIYSMQGIIDKRISIYSIDRLAYVVLSILIFIKIKNKLFYLIPIILHIVRLFSNVELELSLIKLGFDFDLPSFFGLFGYRSYFEVLLILALVILQIIDEFKFNKKHMCIYQILIYGIFIIGVIEILRWTYYKSFPPIGQLIYIISCFSILIFLIQNKDIDGNSKLLICTMLIISAVCSVEFGILTFSNIGGTCCYHIGPSFARVSFVNLCSELIRYKYKQNANIN